jgi:TRAP-type C4-dicarboxylate transport system substrate-binding protein
MRVVFSTREIGGTKDIKGMKLRINPTPVYRDLLPAVGAAPTPIPTPQVFDAMATAVDGLEADIEFSWNQRFDKACQVHAADERAVHALRAAGLGPRLAGPERPDRELIRGLVRQRRSTRRSATS